MRERHALNFQWDFSLHFTPAHLTKEAVFEQKVDIPHSNVTVPYNNFNEKISQGICVYRKIIEVPAETKGKIHRLYFEGVGHRASVYCNGKLCAEHRCGYTLFSADCTPHLIYGASNTITVVADSRESLMQPPFGNVIDFLVYGGIYREVYWDICEPEYIEDVFLYCRNPLDQTKLLEIEVSHKNAEGLELIAQVKDGDKLLAEHFEKNLGGGSSLLQIPLQDVELWSPHNPKRYTIIVQLMGKKGPKDSHSHLFGFREAVFKRDGFFLNGKRIKLIGLDRHQSFPHSGYAMPQSAQVKDAEILKNELALNCVRTSHYPPSRHFIEACDALGLMVFEEIPGWQYISSQAEWRSQHLQNIRDMILRDRSRACVILWGVRINESTDDKDLYGASNKIARELDPTRQTGGVRCFAHSQLLEDVYTYNDFIHNGENMVLQDPKNITHKNSAPYLVTEYMGHMFPTKSFDTESKRLEHAVRHARIINGAYTNNRISGIFGWVAFDYNTHKDFGSGDRICYHGVMDMFRIPKLAAAAYSSQNNRVVLEVSSDFNIGEHSASRIQEIYIFTNCDCVRVYRNSDLIDTFYPSSDIFPHLKHPPIVLEDLFGRILIEKEGMSEEESDEIKAIYRVMKKLGWENLTEDYKQSAGEDKVNLTNRLYGKYIANWGAKHVEYTFEGYKDGKLVKTVVKAASQEFHLDIRPDCQDLFIGDSYDTARICFYAKDEHGNRLVWANDAFSLAAEGPIEIIGDSLCVLIGGVRAVWIKTKGLDGGEAALTVSSPRFGEQKITFAVHKKN